MKKLKIKYYKLLLPECKILLGSIGVFVWYDGQAESCSRKKMDYHYQKHKILDV